MDELLLQAWEYLTALDIIAFKRIISHDYFSSALVSVCKELSFPSMVARPKMPLEVVQ